MCPNCKNENVRQPDGEGWYLDVSDGTYGVEIKFCPFCGHELDSEQIIKKLPNVEALNKSAEQMRETKAEHQKVVDVT